MAQTFDTSRVGGGTYELEQDASGNYKLKSVGFAQVNKLNLPDLATSDVAPPTIGPITKQPVDDPKVADPFKKLGAQNTGGGEGGGQDYSGVMLKTPEVKDVSVRDAGEMRKQQIEKAGGVETSKGQMYATDAGFQIAEDQANQQRAEMTDNNIGFQQSQTVDPITGAGRSQSDKFKERFDPTKIKAAPERVTGLQKVKSKASDAISKTKKVIGTVAKMLIPGANLISAIMPEETAVQKVNKSYFNVRGGNVDGNRIAGNPATDLYAGMNRTSDFGNLEKAGNKRLATRQKTIERKGYKAGDKFFDDTQKMKEDARAYKQAKETATDTSPGATGGEGGGGGGSDSGRVICTDLHRTGELSTRDWIRDTKFTFKTLSIKHVKGYLLWAEPTVKHIQKYPRYRKIWKHIAQHRANDIAWRLNEGKFDLLGRIYAGIGEPVCWMLGNFVSDKQISKYNLTHWRRA
jgi:hypothetical protein